MQRDVNAMFGPTSELRVKLPAPLARALERAARSRLQSVSDLTRQALLERLQRDGIVVDPVRQEASS